MKKILLFLFVLFGLKNIQAQCINSTLYPSATATASNCNGTTIQITTCNYAGEYSNITIAAGATYSFAGTGIGYVTITDASNAVLASGASPLTYVSTISGTIRAHWNLTAACGTDASCHTTSVTTVSGGTGTTPLNDECATAMALTLNASLLCAPTAASGLAATTQCATASTTTPAPTCSATGANDDVWFTFTTSTAGTYLVQLNDVFQPGTTTTTTMGVQLYTGSGCTLSTVACLTGFPGTSGTTNYYNFAYPGLLASTTYTVRVYTTATTATFANFNIEVGPNPGPVNDECAAAVTIPLTGAGTCIGGGIAGTTACASLSNITDACATTGDNDDVWYSFTTTNAGNYVIEMNDVFIPGSTSTTTMGFQIYTGTCAALTPGAATVLGKCATMFPTTTGVPPGVTNYANFSLGGLAAATTYFIKVYTTSTAGTNANFNIKVYGGYGTPANDNCPGAVSLTMAPEGTCSPLVVPCAANINATQTFTPCTGNAQDDVWYSFTPPVGVTCGKLTIAGNNTYRPVIEINSTGCSTPPAVAPTVALNPTATGVTTTTAGSCYSSSAVNGTIILDFSDLVPGQPYYFKLHDFTGAAPTSTTGNMQLPLGGYTICMEYPAPDFTIALDPTPDEGCGLVSSDVMINVSWKGCAGSTLPAGTVIPYSLQIDGGAIQSGTITLPAITIPVGSTQATVQPTSATGILSTMVAGVYTWNFSVGTTHSMTMMIDPNSTSPGSDAMAFNNFTSISVTSTSNFGAPLTPIAGTTITVCPGSSISLEGTCPNTSVEIVTPVTSFSGSIDNTDPTFVRPFAGTPPTSLSSNTVYYDTYTFSPTVSGSYTFNANLSSGDTYGHLYLYPFNPTSPLTNVLAGNDDTAGDADPLITINLTAGTLYTYVASTFGALSATGSYTVNFTSMPAGAAINLIDPVEGTLTWWNSATGGTQIGTGSPFVPAAPYVDVNTPGVYTVYAQCSDPAVATCGVSPRTAVTIVVAEPIVVSSSTPYCETFEAGPAGWSAAPLGGTTNNDWAWGTPSAASGKPTTSNMWASNLTGPYMNATQYVAITSGCFDLSGLCNPRLAVDVFYASELSWDGLVLQASVGGAAWQTIYGTGASGIVGTSPSSWYNATANTMDDTPVGGSTSGTSCWNGNSGGVLCSGITLPTLAGQSSVKFRFVSTQDGANGATDVGWAFDNFRIFDLVDIVPEAVTTTTPINLMPDGDITDGACGSQDVLYTIKNNGTCAIDLSKYNVDVVGNIGTPSGIPVPVNYTINTGTLTPGATATYTVLTGLDMSAPGAYEFGDLSGIQFSVSEGTGFFACGLSTCAGSLETDALNNSMASLVINSTNPAIVLTTTNLTYCEGSTLDLNTLISTIAVNGGPGGGTLSWYNTGFDAGVTTGGYLVGTTTVTGTTPDMPVTVTPASPADINYYVVYSDAISCPTAAAISLSVVPLPTVTLSPAIVDVCGNLAGNTITVDGNVNGSQILDADGDGIVDVTVEDVDGDGFQDVDESLTWVDASAGIVGDGILDAGEIHNDANLDGIVDAGEDVLNGVVDAGEYTDSDADGMMGTLVETDLNADSNFDLVTDPTIVWDVQDATMASLGGYPTIAAATPFPYDLLIPGGTPAGTYTVTATVNVVTGSTTCTNSASFTITVTDKPELVAVPATQNICVGGTPVQTILDIAPSAIASFDFYEVIGGTYTNIGTGPTTDFGTTIGSSYWATPGTYYFAAIAVNGVCSDTASFNVVVLEPIAITEIVTNVTCNGLMDGAIDITVTGGDGAYTFAWDDAAASTTEDVTGLPVGTYTVVVTDGSACTATATYAVTEPAILAVTTSFTNPLCFGAADGTASVVVTGGTTPYTYIWDDAAASTTADVSGLIAGTYNVTITDANTCTTTATVTLTDPTALAGSVTVVDALCNGDMGSVTAVATGGTGAYSYMWDDATASTVSSLNVAAGTYNVSITDANGCNVMAMGVVAEPTVLTVSATEIMPISCNGGTGTIQVTAAGGTVPYTGEGVFNETAGTYTYTITDFNGCSATTTITTAEPTALTATATATDVTCNGAADGSVMVTPAGGIAPYTIAEPTTGLVAGTYTFTVSDANTCTITVTATVGEPTALTASAVSTDATCNGAADGSVVVTPTGGTAPYSIAEPTTGLAAGTYTFTITDNNGCITTTTATIAEPSTLMASAMSTDAQCNGGTGSVMAMPSGGTAPYTYLWDDVNASSSATVSNLAAGTYSVVVTDNNGCTTTASATIAEPTALTASATASNATCNGAADGSVVVTPAGGTAPYTVAEPTTGLVAGTYTFTVTDANTCTTTVSATVGEPTALTASATASNATCNGAADGSVVVTPAGGTAPYTVAEPTTGLVAGTYTFTVTDANTCTTTVSATVGEPTALTATATASNAACNGAADGSVVVTPAGGTAPYTVAEPTTGLVAGTYTFTITDNNGCMTTTSATIAEPTSLTASAMATDALCNGGTGSVMAMPTGGTAPYTYLWDDVNASSSATVSSLVAGTYSVVVTDNNGCTTTASATIAEPTALTVSATETSSISCNGGSAMVDVVATGGIAPYTGEGTFTVNAGTITYTVTDQNGCSASTTITVTEPTALVAFASDVTVCNGDDMTLNASASGGSGTLSYTWSGPGITGTLTGASVTLSGVTTAAAGTYTVDVMDANGCMTSATSTATVNTCTTPTALYLDVTDPCFCINNATDNLGTGGQIGANYEVGGGTGSYVVSIVPTVIGTMIYENDGTGTELTDLDADPTNGYQFNAAGPLYANDLRFLAGGSYTVSVNDGMSTVSAGPYGIDCAYPQVTAPASLSACEGGNVTINATAVSGISSTGVTYSWNTGENTSSLNVVAGTLGTTTSHTVTVGNSMGCTVMTTTDVNTDCQYASVGGATNGGVIYEDMDQNGTYNPGETWTDVNSDGVWDASEPFVDADGDGTLDATESFTDDNGNGIWDSGEAYVDVNGNGSYDNNTDTPIAGAVVTLTDAGADGIVGTADDVVSYSTTDVNGEYAFTNVMPGDYTVSVAASGYAPSTPASGTVDITLANGENQSPIFGMNTTTVVSLGLLNFVAIDNCNTITINWNAVNEEEIASYMIQRSLDGINFITLGSIDAGSGTYTFDDMAPKFGDNYYRIMAVKTNGTSDMSNVILGESKCSSTLEVTNIYPNPVENILYFTVESTNETSINLVLMDELGRVVVSESASIITGTNTLSIDVTSLAKAVYVAGIVKEDGQFVGITKVIVSK